LVSALGREESIVYSEGEVRRTGYVTVLDGRDEAVLSW
jgi:hypothetical protein